jgi:ketosteroid isomerase-like protein
MERTARVHSVLQAVDDRDIERFCAHLHERAVFRFANAPPARGRAAIREALTQFFGRIAAIAHTVEAAWDTGDALVVHGHVTYTRPDGSELSVPFANIWHMDGDAIAEYLVFVDASALG